MATVSPRVRYAALAARSGRRAPALRLAADAINRAERLQREGVQLPDLPLDIAGAHAILGDHAVAVEWLERAFAAGFRSGPSVRYLLISISARTTADERIVLLGHELRHAYEVASAPEIRDRDSMRRFFERIGERYGRRLFETRAACDTSRQVLEEITAGRPVDAKARLLAERLAKAGYLSSPGQESEIR